MLSLLLARGGGRGRSRDTLLLVGLCGAGKTALFSRLRGDGGLGSGGGALTATAPSMEENEAPLARRPGSARRLRLVDLPGHPRLRGRIDSVAARCCGVVCVVDAREGVFGPSARDVAECVSLFRFHIL